MIGPSIPMNTTMSPHMSLLSPRTRRSGRVMSQSAKTIRPSWIAMIGRSSRITPASFTLATIGPQAPARLHRIGRAGADPLLDSGRFEPTDDATPKEALLMTDDRERWALILGGSSGMGEATALTLAGAGYNIIGIHLDFRAALAHVEKVKAGIEAKGVQSLYINMNAADDEKRAAAVAAIGERFAASKTAGREPYSGVVMRSPPFGSLVPVLTEDPKCGVDGKKMEIAQDVLANSLVYWV